MLTYTLTPEQKKKFENTYKIAILHQLYADGMLTDVQLNQIIKLINEEMHIKEY